MTTCRISRDAKGSLTVVESPAVALDDGRAPDFPVVNIGGDPHHRHGILLHFFGNWALALVGRCIVVRVEDDGDAKAWVVSE